jgi:magnesium-transporting ATPase (P-type)
VYAGVTRFLTFQLTINLVAVATAVGGALASAESPLTAVQLLWVNLIMDSLASLALATEPPDARLLTLPPFAQGAPRQRARQPAGPAFCRAWGILSRAHKQRIMLNSEL